MNDRQVSYQPLALTLEEKQAVLDALIVNYQPEHRIYRYNFVYDNCATRPWKILRKAAHLPEAEGMSGITWRKACDHYTGRWSCGKYGINLLFGYEADREMTREQSLFLPENLMNYVSEQGLSDDESTIPFTPRDGQFKSSPELLTIVLILLALVLTWIDLNKKRYCTWAYDITLYAVFFALGTIVFVMYFFSQHPFVGSNMNILLLNPIWVLPLVFTAIPTTRKFMLSAAPWLLCYMTVAVVIIMLLGQTLHPILCLLLAQQIRLYYLRKKL